MGDAESIGVIVRLSKVLEIVLADLGLTMNQYRFLTLVAERSPSAAELSTRLVMKPPNVSVLTRGLVERGLVEQGRQSGDGRRRTLELTSAGRDLIRLANRRCASTLRYLEAESADNDLVASLERWLPALDAEALRMQDSEDGASQKEDRSRVRRPSSGPGRSRRRG